MAFYVWTEGHWKRMHEAHQELFNECYAKAVASAAGDDARFRELFIKKKYVFICPDNKDHFYEMTFAPGMKGRQERIDSATHKVVKVCRFMWWGCEPQEDGKEAVASAASDDDELGEGIARIGA